MRAGLQSEKSSASISADARTKKPGAVSRPGTNRQFQFPEYSDLWREVKTLACR
jgi:hypothetical protein